MKILSLGTNGFPYGLAAVEKQKLIAKALQIGSTVEVEIICNNSYSDKSIPRKGVYENIKYQYTCLYTKRGNNIITRKINAYYGKLFEFILLLINPYDVIIASTRDFFQILRYVIAARIRGKKILITAVEDKSIMMSSKTFLGKIDNYLYQKYVWKIIDGAFPISEELSSQILKSNPNLPTLKLPAIVDFRLFEKQREKPEKFEYFLFCGAAAYFKTISFIIDSYSNIKLKSRLVLVINGSKDEINKIHQYINENNNASKIMIISNLSFEQLIAYYQNAKALLIPLNFNQQDKARFPHKIGEYCASGKPIISSKWGEVDYYFRHGENALLLNSKDTTEFSNYLKEIEKNDSLAKKLAGSSFKLGLKEFNYENYSNPMKTFLESL